MSTMSAHILVRWASEPKWDVYPIRSLRSADVQCRLNDDHKYAKEMTEPVDVQWKDDKYAPAFVLAVGK